MLVKESRALFGAFALIITGAILSSMAHQYFAGQYTGEAIVRSRSWWEIVLNLQVLCLAFMWFCYADRVRVSDKRRALVMRLRMVFGLVAVSVPFLIAVAAVYFGWFEKRPSVRMVDLIVCYMLFFWGVSACIPKFFALRAQGGSLSKREFFHKMRPRSVWAVAPAIAGLVVITLDGFWGVSTYYFLIPTLFYLQAAMPFLFRALGRPSLAIAAE